MAAVRTRRVIDPSGANAVISAAEQVARDKGHRVVIAVVDPWGHLMHLRRTEDAQIASDRVAIDKARTAAIFVRPTRVLEDQVRDGRLGALALHDAAALTGGIPLTVHGEVVGAIGTSGETPDEDEAVSLAGANAEFSTREVPALTYDGARQVAEAAAAVAGSRGVAPVIAVVDAGGEVVFIWRPDAAQVASVQVATDKARTAAIFRRPSKDFEDQASHGRPSALHLAGGVPLQGGLPLIAAGRVVGAIGVSGASSADEDQELATIGVETFDVAASARPAAAYFPSETVRAQFETGGLLHDTAAYKVDAGRRTGPGDAEYHARVTDIMLVIEGKATVVTGGRLRDGRSAGSGELRAPAIDGGVPHELAAGDVLVVPSGVPHQFVEVSDPFLYFVTKVEA